MREKHLFFDLDGMTFDTLPSTVRFINHHYGTNLETKDILNRGSEIDAVLRQHTGDNSITKDDFYNLYGKEYLTSVEWHADATPMPYAPEIIGKLSQQYTIHTVTARQQVGINVIKHLIGKHLQGKIENIHCVWRKNEFGEFYKIPKHEYIQNVNGLKLAFFDDSHHEIESMQGILPSFLFDPYNFHPEVSDAKKVKSWLEIGEIYL